MTETTNVNNNINFAETLNAVKDMLNDVKGKELTQTDVDSLVEKLTVKATAELLEKDVAERTSMYKTLLEELQDTNAQLIAKLGENTLIIERNKVDLQLKDDEINSLGNKVKSLKVECTNLTEDKQDAQALAEDRRLDLITTRERIKELEDASISDGKKLERRVREEVAKITAEHEIALTEERLRTAEAKAKYDTLKGQLAALKISNF